MPKTMDAAAASTPVTHVVVKTKRLFFSSVESGFDDLLSAWMRGCRGDVTIEAGFSPSVGAGFACDESICSFIRGKALI